MPRVLLVIAMLCGAACCSAAAPAFAQTESEADGSVELAREALERRGRMPWYDAAQDDLRALTLPADRPNDFSNRRSRWSSEPPSLQPSQTPNTSWSFPSLTTILQYAFWTVLTLVVLALLIGLVWMLVKAYLDRESSLADETLATSAAGDERDEDRIQSLPFEMARPRGDLLDEAEAAYQAGDYRRAVIFLFSHLLIHLDKHQQIRLARGKTNRQYLRELRSLPEVRAIVEQTMHAFEDVFFGDHALSREEFEACWSQLDHFHQRVEQIEQVAV